MCFQWLFHWIHQLLCFIQLYGTVCKRQSSSCTMLLAGKGQFPLKCIKRPVFLHKCDRRREACRSGWGKAQGQLSARMLIRSLSLCIGNTDFVFDLRSLTNKQAETFPFLFNTYWRTFSLINICSNCLHTVAASDKNV